MREKPDLVARCSACRSDLSSSIQTTSVRGTITSRTMVSPRSKTLCSISRSVSSTTPRLPAMSTSSRSSMSEENGPSRKPRPGVMALPIRISSEATGDSTLARPLVGPASASPTV